MIRNLLVLFLLKFWALLNFVLMALGAIVCIPFLPIIFFVMPFILSRDRLRNRAGVFIRKYPKLRFAIRIWAFRLGYIKNNPRLENDRPQNKQGTNKNIEQDRINEPEELSALTPHARDIYYQLADACGIDHTSHKSNDSKDLSIMCRGSMKALDSENQTWGANKYQSIVVEVINKSDDNWQPSESHPIYISYHWLSNGGSVIVQDGLRTSIGSEGLCPDQSSFFSVLIKTPETKGNNLLIVSLVYEGVTWFEHHGFDPALIKVEVV